MNFFSGLLKNRRLIWQMILRDISSRYKGTFFGLFWAIVTPIFMLAIYSFVFTKIFNGRWDLPDASGQFDFAIILFLGLILYNLMAEVITVSPKLILNNKNFVKKVVFPLEVLPAISIGTAVFHAMLSVVILLIFQLFARQYIPFTFWFFPLMVVPFLFLTMGISLILAALGVFIRDLNQIIRPLMTALLFLAPIVYPTSLLPEQVQPLILLNPLSFIVEQARDVVIIGKLPNVMGWVYYTLVSLFVFILGSFIFNRSKKAFADVL